MPNITKASINASGIAKVKPLSDEEKALKQRKEELKGKIKMKERRTHSEMKKLKEEMENNERIIEILRHENAQLRTTTRRALDSDKELVSHVLCHRKRDRLAHSGKPSKDVISEIDQTVCDHARKMNELMYKKRLRIKRLEELREKQSEKFVPEVPENDDSPRKRQLENSLSKMSLKASTAFNIQGVYEKLLSAVEEEVRHYPKKLDELEKGILVQRKEISELKTIEMNALAERDATVTAKLEFEKTVREMRKERDLTLKRLRNIVREVSVMSELPHTTKRGTRYHTETAERISEKAKRTEERLEKIKEYEAKSNMIEIAIVACFRNQQNSAEDLKRKTKENQELLRRNKKMLDSLQNNLDKLKKTNFQKEENLNKEIQLIYEKQQEEQRKREKLTKSKYEQENLITQVMNWLEPVTTRLVQCCSSLELHDSQLIQDLRTKHKNLEADELFETFMELLFKLSKEALSKFGEDRTINYCADTSQFALKKSDDEILIEDNNNRIAATVERKTSEDFDYNTPNNEAYVTRDMIKRQSESRQKRK